MTKFKEYRIPMPLTLDEYRLGQQWTEKELLKETFENCSSCLTIFDHRDENERAEILKEKFPVKNLPLNISAATNMTHKRYNVKDQIPKSVELLFLKSKNDLILDEYSWDVWPFTLTIIECNEYHWRIIIRSHYRNNHSADLYETNRKILQTFYSIDDEQEKSLHDCEIINIAERLEGKDYRSEEDPTKTSSRKKPDLLPLHLNAKWYENWPNQRPSMCVFKLIELVVLNEKSLLNKATNKLLWSMIVKTQKMIYHRFHQKLISNVDRWIDDGENKSA